jgi:hypothetical protein
MPSVPPTPALPVPPPPQDGNKHALGQANPFADGEAGELASAGYRYRKWTLGPGGPEIVVRCEVNSAVTTPKGEVQLASIKVGRGGRGGRGGRCGSGASFGPGGHQTHGPQRPRRKRLAPVRASSLPPGSTHPFPPAPPSPTPKGPQRVEPQGDRLAQEAGPVARLGEA